MNNIVLKSAIDKIDSDHLMMMEREMLQKMMQDTLSTQPTKMFWGTGEIQIPAKVTWTPKSPGDMLSKMGVDQVIFNNEATVVILKNGTKGVAIKSKDDHFDPIVGFSVAYAIAKSEIGNKSKFKHFVSKLYHRSMKKKK